MGSDGLTQSPAATRRFRPMPSDADFLAYDHALAAWQQAPEAGPPPEFPWPEVQTVAVAPAPVKAPEAALPPSASALDHAVAIAQTTADKLKLVYKDSLKPVLDKIAVYQAWWPNQVKYGIAYALSFPSSLIPSQPAATFGTNHLGFHTHNHLFLSPTPAPAPIFLPSIGPIILKTITNVHINGLSAATEGSLGIAITCGGFVPIFTVKTGSSSVFTGGERAARVADLTTPCESLTSDPPADNFALAFQYLAPKLNRIVRIVSDLQGKMMASVQWAHYSASWLYDEIASDAEYREVANEIDSTTYPEVKEALLFKQEMMDSAVKWKYFYRISDLCVSALKSIEVAGRIFQSPKVILAMLSLLGKLLPARLALNAVKAILKSQIFNKLVRLSNLLTSILSDKAVLAPPHFLTLFGSPNVLIGGIMFSNTWAIQLLNEYVMGPLVKSILYWEGIRFAK